MSIGHQGASMSRIRQKDAYSCRLYFPGGLRNIYMWGGRRKRSAVAAEARHLGRYVWRGGTGAGAASGAQGGGASGKAPAHAARG